MTQPIDELTPPVSHDPVPNLVENILGGAQYISPSYWLGEALKVSIGLNPGEWIAAEFAGDWAALQKVADSIRNVAEFSTSYGVAVGGGMNALASSWTGNAADAAGDYFTDLSTAIKGQAPSLRMMANQLDDVAMGMYETANAVKGLYETLLDHAIALGISLAASTTGIGAVVGGPAAAWSITRVIQLWLRIVDAHTAAWDGAQAAIGLIAGYLGDVKDRDLRGLPASSYNHPGA